MASRNDNAANESAEFFQLVGEIITTWSSIESKIFRIFRLLLHTDRQFAAILFFRSPTLKSRFDTVDELIKAAFPRVDRPSGGKDHPLVRDWKKIARDLAPLIEFRNMLAHHQVSWKSNASGSGIQIHYNVNESYRGKTPKIDVIKLAALKAHKISLWTFFEEVTSYMQKIKAKLPAEPLQKEFRKLLGLSLPHKNSG